MQAGCLILTPEMRDQKQYASNDGENRITDQVDGMAHFFTIALDHRLQFFDFFRRDFSLDKAIEAITNAQHSKNKIDTDIHKSAIVTQLDSKQYKESKCPVLIVFIIL
jgi:hypothetical protein